MTKIKNRTTLENLLRKWYEEYHKIVSMHGFIPDKDIPGAGSLGIRGYYLDKSRKELESRGYSWLGSSELIVPHNRKLIWKRGKFYEIEYYEIPFKIKENDDYFESGRMYTTPILIKKPANNPLVRWCRGQFGLPEKVQQSLDKIHF